MPKPHTVTRLGLATWMACAGLWAASAQAGTLDAVAPSTDAVLATSSSAYALRHGHRVGPGYRYGPGWGYGRGHVVVRGGWGPRVVIGASPWWWTPAVTVPIVIAGTAAAAEALPTPTADVVPPAPATPARPEPIIYPRNGQSAEQLEADRQDCNRWAATQNGALADSSIFMRAVDACMDGRGYTTK